MSKKLNDMEEKVFTDAKPDYYNDGEVSCIEAMIAAKGLEKTIAFCECCTFKYEWRLGRKDDVEREVRKIKEYLDIYLELVAKRDMKEACKKIVEDPSSWVVDEERPWIVTPTKSELLQKGLTDREAENIINK